MKTLIQIVLLALLVGCASPYYPVYVNDEGDYYIAERATNESYYYGTGYYPWWISGYPPQTFAYYSPYYGFYGGYYGYWCPPYRYHRRHRYPGEGRIVVSPALPPATDSGHAVVFPGSPVNRGRKGQRVVAPAPRMSAGSPARFSLPSTHAGSAGRGKVDSSRLSTRHRQ